MNHMSSLYLSTAYYAYSSLWKDQSQTFPSADLDLQYGRD